MNFIKTKNKYTSNGYTLMEALVAISVIVFAMVGPLSLAAKSLADAQFAKDQITAFYLAQEAIEWVHNAKDEVADTKWNEILSNCLNSPCSIDAIGLTSYVAPCGSGCVPLMVQTFGLKIYRTTQSLTSEPGGTNGYAPTRYTRITSLAGTGTGPSTNKEYKVSVSVRWTNGSNPKSLNLSEYIFRK